MEEKTNINILDKRSIEKAINEIEEYEKNLSAKCETFVNKLSELGLYVISDGFMKADYAGDKSDLRYYVDHVQTTGNNTYSAKIHVDGSSVLFIEFGYGISKADNEEARTDLKSENGLVQHGEYGNKNGANENGWFYVGNPTGNDPSGTSRVMDGNKETKYMHTYGNDALSPMYNGKKSMQSVLYDTAREVFE